MTNIKAQNVKLMLITLAVAALWVLAVRVNIPCLYGGYVLVETPPEVITETVIVNRYIRDFTYEAELLAELNYWVDKYWERVSVPGFTYFGTFRVTAYCSCEICCGHYAINRPWVGNREIAITASGAVAEVGITVAVDPDYIPWGTVLYIEGLGVRIAQDRGGAVNGRHLDVFFGSHQEALEWGNQHRAVWVIKSPN